jgi:hypothetical protein
MLSYVFNRIFSELDSQRASYFGVVFTQMFGTFSHALNVSWMSLTCDDSEQRALAMALWVFFLLPPIITTTIIITISPSTSEPIIRDPHVRHLARPSDCWQSLITHRVIMGANIGGIYGAQLLRADDRPRYRRGFSIACAIVAFGVACAVFRYVVGGDVKARRKQLQQQQSHLEGDSDTEGGRMRMRLSSEDVHGRGHGAAMMRVATADGDIGNGDGDGGNAEITDGDTDETLVAITSSHEKAKGDGGTDEMRKSDVIVRERKDGELHVVDDAAAYRSWLESEIGFAR